MLKTHISNWAKRGLTVLLFLGSIFLALLLFELLYKNFFMHKGADIYHWDKRYMLFSDYKGGSVFKNSGSIFTYQPNSSVLAQAYYFVNGKWGKEYEYVFQTNDFGLIQSTNIDLARPNILFLGDSFTEGHGAIPWLEEFKANFDQNKHRFINGGILGTGFNQWELLHDQLIAQGVKIHKLVVIFISDDYSRGVWNMPESTLKCISNYKTCGRLDSFYGTPPPEELGGFLENLKKSRSFTEDLKQLFPATYRIYKFVRGRRGDGLTYSRQTIQNFIQLYGENLLFVHIPQKDEIVAGRISKLGLSSRKDIEDFGGTLVDGFAGCKLLLDDYHMYDGHPNAAGYKKISTCVRQAIKEKWGL